MDTPLYIKFRTSNHPYFFDAGTGEIVEINEAIHAILDDYRRLSFADIVRKHSEFEESVLKEAFEELENSRLNESLLVDRPHTSATEIGGIHFQKRCYSLEEFISSFSSMIILGVTEKCNLRCSYCCYGEDFKGHRSHGSRSMSYEIAEKAIDDHIHSRQKDDICAVSFYGGEPLLEFDLVQRYRRNPGSKLQ